MDRGPADEGTALQGKGNGTTLTQLPANGGQQPGFRHQALGAGIHQDERAGAEGALGIPGLETGLAEQRRLLITGDPGDGNTIGQLTHAFGMTQHGTGGNNLGQRVSGHAKELQQVLIPLLAIQVQQ